MNDTVVIYVTIVLKGGVYIVRKVSVEDLTEDEKEQIMIDICSESFREELYDRKRKVNVKKQILRDWNQVSKEFENIETVIDILQEYNEEDSAPEEIFKLPKSLAILAIELSVEINAFEIYYKEFRDNFIADDFSAANVDVFLSELRNRINNYHDLVSKDDDFYDFSLN